MFLWFKKQLIRNIFRRQSTHPPLGQISLFDSVLLLSWQFQNSWTSSFNHVWNSHRILLFKFAFNHRFFDDRRLVFLRNVSFFEMGLGDKKRLTVNDQWRYQIKLQMIYLFQPNLPSNLETWRHKWNFRSTIFDGSSWVSVKNDKQTNSIGFSGTCWLTYGYLKHDMTVMYVTTAQVILYSSYVVFYFFMTKKKVSMIFWFAVVLLILTFWPDC